MSVSSIPTNYDYNKSFTDDSTTILWPSSEYRLSKSLGLCAKYLHWLASLVLGDVINYVCQQKTSPRCIRPTLFSVLLQDYVDDVFC